MALVCPAGHPPGVGTTFCRLCGRPYVDAAELPADSELAVLAAQRETLEQVRAAVAPAAALPVPERAAVLSPSGAPPLLTASPEPGVPVVPSQQAGPVRVAPVPAAPAGPPLEAPAPAPHPPAPAGVHIQMPLVPSSSPEAPHVEQRVPVVEAAQAPTQASAEPAAAEPAAFDPVVPGLELSDELERDAHRHGRVVVLATLAGFVGGAISGAGVQYLLG